MIESIQNPPSFGVKFEGGQLPIPTELKNASNLKLNEITFISFDQFPAFEAGEEGWVDVLVTETGEIYKEETQLDYEFSEEGVKKKEQSSKLTKIEDFTGTVTFGAYLPLDLKEEGDSEGKDFSIVYRATFVEGKFTKAEVTNISGKSSSSRVNLMDKINKEVIKQVKLMNNPLYRWIYSPYKTLIGALVMIVSYIWVLPLRLFIWLSKLITPI